jgi:hypothetical protein
MPIAKAFVKPITKLTKEQWKVIVQRMMARGEKNPDLMRTVADEFHGGKMGNPADVADSIERVGALHSFTPAGQTKVERYPIAEARAKYFAEPERYEPQGYGPPADIVEAPAVAPSFPLPAGGAEPDMATQIAMKRVQQVPIIPPGVSSARSIAKKEMVDLNPDVIPPQVTPKTALEEAGVDTGKEVAEPAIGKITQIGLIADQLWREMGGMKSTAGQMWEMYRKASRQAPHIKTGRDYFIRSFVRFHEDPAKFKKSYPREAKILKRVWKEYLESVGGGE